MSHSRGSGRPPQARPRGAPPPDDEKGVRDVEAVSSGPAPPAERAPGETGYVSVRSGMCSCLLRCAWIGTRECGVACRTLFQTSLGYIEHNESSGTGQPGQDRARWASRSAAPHMDGTLRIPADLAAACS